MRHRGGREHGGTPLFHASGPAIRLGALAIRLMAPHAPRRDRDPGPGAGRGLRWADELGRCRGSAAGPAIGAVGHG